MTTERFDMSLRLRHENSNLSGVSKQLGLSETAGWDKGDQNRTLQGALRPGTRDVSYRSFNLDVPSSADMNDVLSACVAKLAPVADVIKSFVDSGGIASLAIGWFCDSAVGGDRISAEIVAKLAQLNLTLDFYLYLTPESSTAAGSPGPAAP
jgi:hypothetical protein